MDTEHAGVSPHAAGGCSGIAREDFILPCLLGRIRIQQWARRWPLSMDSYGLAPILLERWLIRREHLAIRVWNFHLGFASGIVGCWTWGLALVAVAVLGDFLLRGRLGLLAETVAVLGGCLLRGRKLARGTEASGSRATS